MRFEGWRVSDHSLMFHAVALTLPRPSAPLRRLRTVLLLSHTPLLTEEGSMPRRYVTRFTNASTKRRLIALHSMCRIVYDAIHNRGEAMRIEKELMRGAG